MSLVNATELAAHLNVTKARVSQYVSQGLLDGCFEGEGRARRFDLVKVADRLKRKLHPGQMMGNGAETRQALKQLRLEEPAARDLVPAVPDRPAPPQSPRRDGLLTDTDPDRYELARTVKVEEEARRLRRANAMDEGTLVLASEAQRRVAEMIAQEVAEFESVLRDGARAIADNLGVDFKAARQILVEKWRAHRAGRVDVLSGIAAGAELSDAERQEDF